MARETAKPAASPLYWRRELPLYQASEAGECGLACIAMLARYHGHDVDLNGLRQRFHLSIGGASLRTLIELGAQLGLSGRALRVEPGALKKLQLPIILHWQMNHFVVLKAAKGNSFIIHDPAAGVRHLSAQDFSDRFTGVALELTRAADFQPVQARTPVRLSMLWSQAHGIGAALAQVIVLSAALQVAVFAAPFYLQLTVDDAIFRGDQQVLLVLALGFAALAAIQISIELLRGWTLQAIGHSLIFQIVGNLVRHLIRLPAAYFERRHMGDILSRIQSSRPIQDVITRGVVAAIIDGGMAVVAGILLCVYAPGLAFIVIASLGLIAIISWIAAPSLQRRQEDHITAAAREQTHLMETVRAATTIKILGGEADRESAWRNLFVDATSASFRLSMTQFGLTIVQNGIVQIQTIAVVFLAAIAVIRNEGFSVGMLLAFLSFRQIFTDRIVALINQMVQFRMMRTHLDRLGDIVHATPEAPVAAAATTQTLGAISARGLSFRYGEGEHWVLKDLDIDIPAGAFVALVGPSGGGKTTLMKVLMGLYPPASGIIELDGRAAAPSVYAAWRRSVGVVAQEDRLFAGSIADNIAFFDPDMNMDEVLNAARRARIHDEIMRMPMQYMSTLGDMGSVLSGGQKQRVLIARALYRKPQILVLDEGTANLDPATENEIAEMVAAMPITRIVVAHRPALVERASMIYEIPSGRRIAH